MNEFSSSFVVKLLGGDRDSNTEPSNTGAESNFRALLRASRMIARSTGSESMLTSIIGWAKGSELARVMVPPVMINVKINPGPVLYSYARWDGD